MKRLLTAVVVGVFAIAIASGATAVPAHDYLVANVRPGDQLNTVFSKTISISGVGFDDYVKRFSGTASDKILSETAQAIRIDEDYRYDGSAPGRGVGEVRDGGSTVCSHDKCATNDQTSGFMFIPYLWGRAPEEIAAGSNWTVSVPAAWEIGPAGSEMVRVVRLDPADHLITLHREGRGSGLSSDDAQRKTLTIMSNGKPIAVTVVPHETHWEGQATFREGVTVCDELIATRDVTLLAADGTRFEGHERVYTLMIGAA